MENMAEVVKEMKGVSAESSMRINDHFVSTLNTQSFMSNTIPLFYRKSWDIISAERSQP